ncbi:bestrophin-3 [Folsomia candida]|uniref:bestrophin-3 n=1 Tax=Folsomia candida TaxID=158441 RepID=UPI000B908B75|nr:bestrophin-3 [Folsomia candida]
MGIYRVKKPVVKENSRIQRKISRKIETSPDTIRKIIREGFYVSLVVGRWWEQFKNIPWIDTLAIWINANIRGNREKDRLLRRTLIRYANLTIVQCFILICPRVKKRFPTMEHLVEGGLLLPNEKEIMQDLSASLHKKYQTNWIPLVWAAGIVTRARTENKIKNDSVANILLTELTKLKDQLNMLISYDWISVPLVYTQVVTLAVYSYFLSCLMGRQWLFNREGAIKNSSSAETEDKWNELDIFLPFFTILQFLFYMGWLKTAGSLLNPFGDDDDFELNWFVDRNLQVGYLIVDGMHKEIPELLKDQYWDEIVPPELPHTVASEAYKESPFEGSTSNVIVSEKNAAVMPPSDPALHASASSHNLLKTSHSAKKMTPIPDQPEDQSRLLDAAADGAIENVDTINFDALTEGEGTHPSIEDVFGIEFKVKKPSDEEVKQGGSGDEENPDMIELDEVVVGEGAKDTKD